MEAKRFDYPFPPMTFGFFVITVGPIALVSLLLMSAGWSIKSLALTQSVAAALMVLFLFWSIAVAFSILLANICPDVRLRSNGIQIRFFLPLRSRWIHLSWTQIDCVSVSKSLVPRGFRRNKKDLMVISSQLPTYYYFPMLGLGHTRKKGFLIMSRIRQYEELRAILESNCQLNT